MWYNINMNYSLEAIVFYILLIDSIGANLCAWSGGDKWYHRHFRIISRYFPMTRGWTTYYLILVIWMGVMLYRAGTPPF
jgi:hypothetical protein